MNKGFTLVELILYVAILGLLLTSLVSFTWDLSYGRVKSYTQQEVSQNLRFATKRMLFETKNASGLNSVTANTLCLASSDASRNPTYFHLNSGRLYVGWGGGSSDCTGLTNDVALTSNEVTVSTLSFTDLSTTGSTNIQFTVTVESNAERQEFDESETYTTSVELRN